MLLGIPSKILLSLFSVWLRILITENLNAIETNAITAKKFNGLGELSGIIKDLIHEEPYKINWDEVFCYI